MADRIERGEVRPERMNVGFARGPHCGPLTGKATLVFNYYDSHLVDCRLSSDERHCLVSDTGL